ncbi:WXG100 family type VII secretion target [Bacillus sp. SJS]|uniref:WXG100 family type VII secretion target n=1 Tax=Bacillus sp. SJS TaxID=1423321 RepID=UPI00068D4E27|nr:WXG100 family type VII secretion target [Bacillus sp. SJS]KZZ85042.1 hypothetical protein AS29_008315 [Bacillus sp. SJS]
MDSNHVTDLARKYADASEKVKDSEFAIRNIAMREISSWSGKTREQFDQEFQDMLKKYNWFAQELLETSGQLHKAAALIEQTNAEIAAAERAKELASNNLSCKKPTTA